MGIFDFLKGKNKNIDNDNGLNEVYFKNGRGKIKERFFKKNGELDGLYETFGEYGNCIITKTNYKNGKKHGRYELHKYKVSFDLNKTDVDETYLFCVINYYEGVSKDLKTYSADGWIRSKTLENGNQFRYSSKDTLKNFEEVLNELSRLKVEVESNRIYKINDFVFEDLMESNSTRPYSGVFEEKQYMDGKYCESVNLSKKESNNEHKKIPKKISKLGSDFKNIKEIIDYIETKKDITIRIEAEEYWGGWYQLKNSKKCQGVIVKEIYDSSGDLAINLKEENGKQIIEFGDGYDEGYDSNKQLKDGKFHIWGIAEISKENILKMLREFGEEESFDSDFLDFINYHIHNCNEIDEAYELLNITEFEVGKGEDFGVNDISWSVEEYINNFSMELVINNPNLMVH